MEVQNQSSSATNTKQSLFLTLLLSAILFWIGLGVGDNISDFHFWIQSTWTAITLEWIFILVYIFVSRKLPPLYKLWKEHRFVTLISILWLFTVLLSYFTAPHYSWQNPLAYMRLAETITHFLFFLFLWDFFSRYTVNYHMIFSAIILSTLVVMAYFGYIHFAFPDLEAEKHVFSMRSDQLVLNTHLHRIGYQVEATIALATALLFSKKQKIIAFLLIGTLFIFLTWLGGRAAILGSIVTLLIAFFYLRKTVPPKIFILSALFSFLLISIGMYFQVLNLDYFVHAMKKTFQAGSLDHLLTGRIEVWSLVFNELQGHWLLGTGPQSYFFYLSRNDEVIHAHNFLLQMLGEWGIAGTALFGVLLYKAMAYGIHLHLKKPIYSAQYHLAGGLTILALTVTGLFGGTYFFTQTSVYLAVAFALWITPSDSLKPNIS